MTTGQCIKRARKNAGLTQKGLAEKLGIAYQTLAQWENDLRNPKYDTIKRIAAALDVEWTELVPEEKQAQTVIEHIDKKLKRIPDIPEDTTEAISELAFYAGAAEGRYKGLLMALNDNPPEEQQSKDDFEEKLKKLSEAARASLQLQLSSITEDLSYADLETIVKYAQFIQSQAQQPPQSPPCPQEGTNPTPPLDGAEGAQNGKK